MDSKIEKASNNRMQRTALRAAADAEGWAGRPVGMDPTTMQQAESRAGANPQASIFWIAAGVQALAVLVVMLGDIGFDKPGRFGLDFGDLLRIGCLWLVASIVGLVTAGWMRRGGLVGLQVAACAAAIAWVFSTH